MLNRVLMRAGLVVLLIGLLPLAPTQAETLMEEVVVVGKRPGPPLWQIRQGDHVVWVFGTLAPIPKKLEWDDEAVRFIASEASAYIERPTVGMSISNPFKAVGYLRRFNRLKKLPDDQTLDAVLPEPLYAQLLEAKEALAPRKNKVLEYRPMYAAEVLWEEALDQIGMGGNERLSKQLRKIAKRNDLEIVEIMGDLDPEDGFAVLERMNLEAEQACLTEALQSIQEDLQRAVDRSLAWADGDASALKQFDYPDPNETCSGAYAFTPHAQAVLDDAEARWIAAIQTALAQHSVTLASLPMREILGEDGLLARLQGMGYEIRGQ